MAQHGDDVRFGPKADIDVLRQSLAGVRARLVASHRSGGLLFKIEIDVGLTSIVTPRIVSPLKVPASCIPA
jgi:hypothetical protein